MPAAPTKSPRAPRRREERTLHAAALTNGPNELFDFILPLWAGAALGLSATEVGILMAVEMALSVIARPIAGVLSDLFERRYVAATGAVLYAASAAGYALAQNAASAYAAAAVGGVGGALLWVAVRAIVSERLAEDSAVFPRLLASQETGSWVAFVAGMVLIGEIGFDGVFWACAGACLLAAALLLSAPRRQVPGSPRGGGAGGAPGATGPGGAPGVSGPEGAAAQEAKSTAGAAIAGLGAVGRRLRPMLLAVVVTMTAEAAISLLLLMHLQREFDLEVVQVAYVFLPGAIVMSVAAERLHGYVVRFGRTRILMCASFASAAFAAGLAWAPNPVVIAALWILSGLAWAAVIPIQQAVIAEASGEHTGRGMGVYESANLLGALIGALTAGMLYDGADWTVACLSAAALILAGAVVVPRAVRSLGVADVPPPPPAPEAEREAEADSASVPEPTGATGTGPASPAADGAPSRVKGSLVKSAAAQAAPAKGAASAKEAAPAKEEPPRTREQLLRELGRHAAVFAVVQVLLMLVGLSWLRDLVTQDTVEVLLHGGGQESGFARVIEDGGKIWVFVLVGHALWTGAKCLAMAVGRGGRD
ncbi:MFS transporter [Streptomyces flavofungini]|uniref:MFS transporter n=1 Tax=Streptomyces flavofungini TaxID=68200 RepID=UPI0025B07B24|nr:MFS transporter [Streptomyces flavofungini]WJV44437.1 MFS transporter [Streptomyces flavofungini]